MLVAARRVGSHFPDGVLSDRSLAILDQSEWGPLVEQMIEASPDEELRRT